MDAQNFIQKLESQGFTAEQTRAVRTLIALENEGRNVHFMSTRDEQIAAALELASQMGFYQKGQLGHWELTPLGWKVCKLQLETA